MITKISKTNKNKEKKEEEEKKGKSLTCNTVKSNYFRKKTKGK